MSSILFPLMSIIIYLIMYRIENVHHTHVCICGNLLLYVYVMHIIHIPSPCTKVLTFPRISNVNRIFIFRSTHQITVSSTCAFGLCISLRKVYQLRYLFQAMSVRYDKNCTQPIRNHFNSRSEVRWRPQRLRLRTQPVWWRQMWRIKRFSMCIK